MSNLECSPRDCTGLHEIDSLWNLHEDFSVTHAAALVGGYNPTTIDRCKDDPSFQEVYPKYAVTFEALTKAIMNGRLRAKLRFTAREYGYLDYLEEVDRAELDLPHGRGSSAKKGEVLTPDSRYFYNPDPDWSLSTVAREDLINWLTRRGIKSGFFFQMAADGPGYLDPSSERYAPKLASAVRAWEAVTVPNGMHPKQALMKWVREHAAEYGLTNDEGKPNETAVDEIAKVANWQPVGGAPKTPGA
ncbi:hypothetical protein [Ralstonia wenshanensis]|uniref:Uncharacterized protein n=1 Tax=Ralstonia wenshanensis TaxID=2842456 RepID=A0AAD2B5B3_9RALS|nr:hypothetical protein [Ralstonia wenshanensis]CAJ0700600.1 hypothetical protein LMG18091_03228 [Ralstonia wenshanensis]